MGAWHIPYTKEAFGQLKERFPDVDMRLRQSLFWLRRKRQLKSTVMRIFLRLSI